MTKSGSSNYYDFAQHKLCKFEDPIGTKTLRFMINFIGTILGEKTVWEVLPYFDSYLDDAISIRFPIPYHLEQREALNYLKQHLQEEEKEWLQFEKNNSWAINLSVFKSKYEDSIEYGLNPNKDRIYDPNFIYLEPEIDTKLTLDMFDGIAFVSPEVKQKTTHKVSQTTVEFIITYEQFMEVRPRKIFLSHKSIDKTLVRDFKETLNSLGYHPWIDEDHLTAGEKLHRGIQKAFKDSCAAIFFITENFQDSKYLATEIDYAITEATERNSEFRIITLVLGEKQADLKVPDLLNQYVYKTPKTHLEALREIIKAIPRYS